MLFTSKTLPYSFCSFVGNTPKIVTFVVGKMKLDHWYKFKLIKKNMFLKIDTTKIAQMVLLGPTKRAARDLDGKF